MNRGDSMKAMTSSEIPEAAYPAIRVLIIEDSPTARGILKRALESGFKGCEIFEAGDGRAAMRELSKGKMDLIITDLEMPGVDGHHFLQTMQGNPILRKKKVLVFSSAIDADTRKKLSHLPNIAFLSKPSTAAGIAQAIQALLKLVIPQ